MAASGTAAQTATDQASSSRHDPQVTAGAAPLTPDVAPWRGTRLQRRQQQLEQQLQQQQLLQQQGGSRADVARSWRAGRWSTPAP